MSINFKDLFCGRQEQVTQHKNLYHVLSMVHNQYIETPLHHKLLITDLKSIHYLITSGNGDLINLALNT